MLKINDKIEHYFNKIDFKAWNCLSCPWLYIFNGNQYVRYTEILKDVVGYELKTTTLHSIPNKYIFDGRIRLRIMEEKDERTYIDRLVLKVNGLYCLPSGTEKNKNNLTAIDDRYSILNKGDHIDLEFIIPAKIESTTELKLEANGYYVPEIELINSRLNYFSKE